MKKIAVIIVIYNSLINESLSYKSLSEQNVDFVFFDNSSDLNILLQNSNVSEKYFTVNKNIGLSKAYNYCISKLDKELFDFVLISDSDTLFPPDYIAKFNSEIERNINVYVPRVVDSRSQKVVHPTYYKKKIARSIKPAMSINNEYSGFVSTINSGVIYRLNIFENMYFNEKLFVEQIDYSFFDLLYENNIYSKVLKNEIVQDFSSRENGDYYLIEGRINFTYRDYLNYYGNIWYILAFLLYSKKSFANKDLKFIKGYFRIYFRSKK